MPIYKKLRPNTRILLVFFAAVFFIVVVQGAVYLRLLDTMASEEQTINRQRMESAAMKLDIVLQDVFERYYALATDSAFTGINSADAQYDTVQMHRQATIALSHRHIVQWAILVDGSDQVVSEEGVFSLQEYFSRLCRAEQYDAQFWQAVSAGSFTRRYFPQAAFTSNLPGAQEKKLLPVASKPFFSEALTVLLFVDVDAILQMDEPYLDAGIYLFSPENTLIYTNDDAAMIDALPDGDMVTGTDGQKYAVYRSAGIGSLQYVKLLPESQAVALLRISALAVFLALALAVVIAVVFMLPTVRRTLHPVNNMTDLIGKHSQLENTNDLDGAYNELAQIIQSREQQASDLARKDATLSEYILHSKLKNVYVDIKHAELWDDAASYILFIGVHYRETIGEFFSMSRAELESCLQEMLSGVLNRLFETTLIFQLEPGWFAARVTLPVPETETGDRMERLMARLAHEEEFAYFTVVQSQLLQPDEDLATVYTQVQEATRHAPVADRSQLLVLPLKKGKGPQYEYASDTKLSALVRNGKTEDAVAVALDVLEQNLARGIDHVQMEALCVAIVNTAADAITEKTPQAKKIAGASGVYNTLIAKCTAYKDYVDAVTGFIRTAAATSEVQESGDGQLLHRVQQYLQENYRNEFSVEEMAAALWVSRSYLSTYYKNKTGMNLSDSIQLFRVQRAMELLKDSSVRTGDVGAMVGISSPNTFLRQFKKYTGMTPTEYRKKENI